GAMLIPQMLSLGYSKEQSMGIIATSGTLGQIIPPSVYMIVYASMTQLDVGDLFMAGILPGLFIATALIITAVVISLIEGAKVKKRSAMKEILLSFLRGLPALLMPIIVLGGIYAGIFTPTEAAAIAVFYVLLISFLFNRKQFTRKNLMDSLVSSMKTTTVIYLLLGGAVLFSAALTYIQIPMVFPTVMALGYDPIHFGVITVACMMISQVTPPVGVSLFVLSGHFNERVTTIIRGSTPYLITLIIATLVLIYVPWISTALVN